MKKLLLLAYIISYTFNLSAQCNDSLPITEDFSDADMISFCWNFIDDDGDTYGWSVIDLSGNNGLVSDSWTGPTGPLTPDNWAITYAIDLTSFSPSSNSIELKWKVRTPDWSFDQERYTVYAATGNQISDFLASSVSFYEDLDNSDGSGLTYANRSLEIGSLAGQMVYIAFRHHNSTDQNEINIDDLSITSSTLGIDDFDTTSFKYYYNTNSDVLTLKSSNAPLTNIQIFNILGQRVLNKKLTHTNESINLSTTADGIYIAQISIDNTIKTIKFLKQ